MNNTNTKKNKTNYYLVLDLMPGANHNEILHAYNRAKGTYTSGSLASYTLLEDDSTQGILEEIEEAFAILGNPSKRRAYDLEMGYNTWSEDSNQDVASRDLDQLMRSSSQVKKTSDVVSRPLEASGGGFSGAGRSSGGMSAKADVEAGARVIPMKSAAAREAPPSNDAFFEPNPEFDKKIQECKELTGEFLKAVRIYRGMTAESLAARCKLSVTHILAVENEEHAPSQAPVYLRGHLYLICQALDLPDPNTLARHYVERMMADNKLQRRNF